MCSSGSSLWSVIDLLRHNTTLFPRVDVKYDNVSDSVLCPILLHLHPHIDLLFSARHQRLHTISLRRLNDPNPPVTLTYKGTVLLSGQSSESLRKNDVSKHFGPTYPGDGLQYPGVSFLFDEDALNSLGGGDARKGAAKVGSPGPEDRYREVRRVIVSQPTVDGIEYDALGEVTECDSMAGSVRQALVRVSNSLLDSTILYEFYLFTKGARWYCP